MKHATDGGITRIEASAQAEHDWVEDIKANSTMNLKFLEACTPGYYNNEMSVPDEKAAKGLVFAGSLLDYHAHLDEFRAAGDFPGALVTKG